MSKQQFAEILKDPYNLDYEALQFMEELRDKYPYCQTVQIILAKGYQKNNSPFFEKQVNVASAYSIDRQQFQNYISEKLYFEEPSEDNTETILKENKQEDQESEETFESTEKELPVNKTEEAVPNEERRKQLEQIVQKRLESFKKNKDAASKNQTPIIPTAIIPEKEKNKKNTRSDEIIEKFIRETPRISSPKDAKPDEGDLSIESVQFNDDIISETLAEIYLKQGKINQSLDIYNKLSLKYPEKSSYFAKKIEQIKKI